MEGSIWLWVIFNLFVVGMLALDLGVFHRKSHAVSGREALIWSIVWIWPCSMRTIGCARFQEESVGKWKLASKISHSYSKCLLE